MWQSIQDRLEKREVVPEADYRKAAPSLRPSFIRPMDSKNILIEGIHIVGSSMWAIHLLYCENVVVRNVMVETYPGANPDGIDIDSSREVRISDSYFDTGDDAIVLKSGRGVDGRRVGRPTENVTITNCTFGRAHGAVVIGSETAGGVRNVVASNIVSKGTEIGIRIKSGRSRGGVVENLRFDNWVIDSPSEGRDPGDELLHADSRGACFRPDAGFSQYRDQQRNRKRRAGGGERGRVAGDANRRSPDHGFDRLRQTRPGSFQYQGAGASQCANRSERRPGFPDP